MGKLQQVSKLKEINSLIVCSEMINSVAGINTVTFFDNFLTVGVVGGIFILLMMDVTWTGKYSVFHFVINK